MARRPEAPPVIALVIGGTRSGKSEVAEQIAQRLGGQVTFVAPGSVSDDDPEMAARIAEHRERRPSEWHTVEGGDDGVDLVETVRKLDGTVLVDSLGTWVAREPDMRVHTPALLDALRARSGSTVLVTDEVGLSVHAPTEVGRRFADSLGLLNAAVATVADRVLLVVAGRVTPLSRAEDAVGRLWL
jgi:adenosyl cobinamide kinase/adenosyl cobinamide phosphate guanylyltransferase